MSLAVGAALPPVRVIDSELNPLLLSDFAPGQVRVLLFFPAAFTPVCKSELCTVAGELAEYNRMGAAVAGISVDGPFALAAFAESAGINYPLFSDFNREAVRAFDLALPSYYGMAEVANRAVFVVNPAGLIAWSWLAPDFRLEPDYALVRGAALAAHGS